MDCTDVNGFNLAKDIRVGIMPILHERVIITLGNTAVLDQYIGISSVVTANVNAILECFGCLHKKIWVIGLLPEPLVDTEQIELLKKQNKSLFKSVRALVHRHDYPVKFIAAHKWLLKRSKIGSDVKVEADGIYYVDGTNTYGLAHLHLLLANELQLRKIKYQWQGMPVVVKKAGMSAWKVLVNEDKPHSIAKVTQLQLRKG